MLFFIYPIHLRVSITVRVYYSISFVTTSDSFAPPVLSSSYVFFMGTKWIFVGGN
jgi:hypothetical protein